MGCGCFIDCSQHLCRTVYWYVWFGFRLWHRPSCLRIDGCCHPACGGQVLAAVDDWKENFHHSSIPPRTLQLGGGSGFLSAVAVPLHFRQPHFCSLAWCFGHTADFGLAHWYDVLLCRNRNRPGAHGDYHHLVCHRGCLFNLWRFGISGMDRCDAGDIPRWRWLDYGLRCPVCHRCRGVELWSYRGIGQHLPMVHRPACWQALQPCGDAQRRDVSRHQWCGGKW